MVLRTWYVVPWRAALEGEPEPEGLSTMDASIHTPTGGSEQVEDS